MFYFRLDRIFIHDNGVNRLFKKLDKANVHIYSFITTGNDELPALKDFTKAKAKEEQIAMIKEAVAQVMSSRIFTPIENIKDEHELTFGDTGIVLYQAPKIPADFNWQLVVIGSKDKIRTEAQMLNDVFNDDTFESFLANILTVLTVSLNPAITAGIEIGKYLTSFILNQYAKKQDDQLGIVYQSWNRQEHYTHGKRFKDGVNDLTKNMVYDYSMFGFEQEIEPKLA